MLFWFIAVVLGVLIFLGGIVTGVALFPKIVGKLKIM